MADRFTGFVQTGLGYQTNPGGGPGPGTVLASGQSFDSRFFAKGDGNWFGAFALNYVHDFENQRGDTFEATLQGYDAQQFSLHQFDIGTLELRAGPRFVLTPGSPYAVSIKPYFVANGALLADTIYSGGAGGGLTMHATVGNVMLDPFAEMVQQSFRNSTFYPLASNLSGPLSTVGLRASGPIASGLGWQARGAFAHSSANFGPDSYDAFAADFWLPWNFSIARRRPALDHHADRGLHPLAVQRPRSDHRSAQYAAHHRMARRARPRRAALEQGLYEHAGAISRRHLERRGLHHA